MYHSKYHGLLMQYSTSSSSGLEHYYGFHLVHFRNEAQAAHIAPGCNLNFSRKIWAVFKMFQTLTHLRLERQSFLQNSP